MEQLLMDMFISRPTPAMLQLCTDKHPNLRPESWRQRDNILISFDIPDKYVIETTETILQPHMPETPSHNDSIRH